MLAIRFDRIQETLRLLEQIGEARKCRPDARVDEIDLDLRNASALPVHHRVGRESDATFHVALGKEFGVHETLYE